jgi:hypothetical protein
MASTIDVASTCSQLSKDSRTRLICLVARDNIFREDWASDLNLPIEICHFLYMWRVILHPSRPCSGNR